MKKKIFLCVIFILLSSAGIVIGKGLQFTSSNTSALPDGEDEEEEIDNYDFLYTNDGETINYDELMMENLIDEALTHLGARYVWGSKGPKTFDCSGFTSYVYKHQNDTFIGASSREQYAQNIPIKRSELQTGDLVFFTSPRSGRNVGHVGIVLDVDPVTQEFTFIHASTKEGVKVSKITDGYYSKRYIGARRVK